MTYRQKYASALAGEDQPLSSAPAPVLMNLVDSAHERHCIAALSDFLIPMREHMQDICAIWRMLKACPDKYASLCDPEVCRKCWDTEMEEQP